MCVCVCVLLDTYTERDVRLHVSRLRDLLGGPYKPNPSTVGIDPAISLLTAITGDIGKFIYEKEKRKIYVCVCERKNSFLYKTVDLILLII